MNFEEVCEGVIKRLDLEKNKRMAVFYFASIGDFFSLCSTVERAEKLLNKEVILLYFTEIHREIISWFEYGDYSIKSARITEEEYLAIRGTGLDRATKMKYQDYIISWDCGDEEFRKFTKNISVDFYKCLRPPVFPM